MPPNKVAAMAATTSIGTSPRTSGHRVRKYVSAPRVSVAVAAPGQSMGSLSVLRLSGTNFTVNHKARIARGTFSQNAARQDALSISAPPIVGPIVVVSAENAAQVPMARPRTSRG